MGEITFRTLRPADIPAAVELINATGFGPLTPALWETVEACDHLTCLALDEGRVIGAIPFALRELVIAPGITSRAAFAHAVSVSSDYRNRGVGGDLMDWSLSELAKACEVACVYTGCEGHSPYRFYERKRFHDLLYAYRFDGAPLQAARDAGLRLVGPDAVTGFEAEMLACFASCYGGAPGAAARRPGYWGRALGSVIFHQGPELVGMLAAADGAELAGYALLAKEYGRLKVLELAVRDREAGMAGRLLAAAAGLAGEEGLKGAGIYCSPDDPFAELARSLGWQQGAREVTAEAQADNDPAAWLRHFIVVGQVLDLPKVAEKSWSGEAGVRDLGLRAWSSATGAVILHPCPPGGRWVNLEMKAETLHRLVLHRLDLGGCIASGIVCVQAGERRDVEAIGRVFSLSPWVYFDLDYI